MRARRTPGCTTRRLATSLAILALASFPNVARAYTFARVGDGTGQSLIWSWAIPSGNCTSNGTCGDVASVDGRIPESYYFYYSSFLGDILAGGMLDWAASTGQLHIVAVPIGWAQVGIENSMTVWTEGTARIDARTTPLVFQLVADAGDPPSTHLRITPRLDGGVYLLPTEGPGSAMASLDLFMSVEVDGQQVSRDSLVTEFVGDPVTNGHLAVTFPKADANVATIPVSPGAEVAIRLWAHERVRSTGDGGQAPLTYGESSYGQARGPAITVDLRTVGPTGVGERAVASGLRLGARPNPFDRASRISYALPRPADARLCIYDLTGARVATLIDRRVEAGDGEVVWDGRDSRGLPVAPGVYLVELVAGTEQARGKLVALGR